MRMAEGGRQGAGLCVRMCACLFLLLGSSRYYSLFRMLHRPGHLCISILHNECLSIRLADQEISAVFAYCWVTADGIFLF